MPAISVGNEVQIICLRGIQRGDDGLCAGIAYRRRRQIRFSYMCCKANRCEGLCSKLFFAPRTHTGSSDRLPTEYVFSNDCNTRSLLWHARNRPLASSSTIEAILITSETLTPISRARVFRVSLKNILNSLDHSLLLSRRALYHNRNHNFVGKGNPRDFSTEYPGLVQPNRRAPHSQTGSNRCRVRDDKSMQSALSVNPSGIVTLTSKLLFPGCDQFHYVVIRKRPCKQILPRFYFMLHRENL